MTRTVTFRSVKFGPPHYKKNRLIDIKNKLLRNVSGSEEVAVIGSWRKLHKEMIHDLYFTL